jgi:hypothetical protein
MKLKKILPLVLIVAGAMFMLSSCDAMLDAIYPSNQILLDVTVLKSFNPDYYDGRAFVSAQIVGTTGVAASASEFYNAWDGVNPHYIYKFYKLSNDTYQVNAQYFGPSSGPSLIYTTGTFQIGRASCRERVSMFV